MSLLMHSTAAEGSITARHYRTGEALHLRWENHQLTLVTPGYEDDCTDLWVAPGLFDLQVNGYAGVDFQRDESIDRDALLAAVHAMRRDGCHRFLLTLITVEWPLLIQKIKAYRHIIKNDPVLSSSIVGWHIEGPFISAEPGYIGAHCPESATDATVSHIDELKACVQNDPLLLTLAPERPGSMTAIQAAVKHGFTVSFGHTNASRQQMDAAIHAGANAFTHLGNGCPQHLDRHDNILWRILDDPKIHAGVIADGIHVSPALFRLIHRLMPDRLIWWTTDAMAAAAAEPGTYSIGKTTVAVGEDGIVRHPTTGGFAGSSLTPIEAIRRGSMMLDRSWRSCWDFLATNTAKLVRQHSDISVGHASGFILLQDSTAQKPLPLPPPNPVNGHAPPLKTRMRRSQPAALPG